jgi:hypothetical protein
MADQGISTRLFFNVVIVIEGSSQQFGQFCKDKISCTGYLDHPFKNRHCETEKDLHPLLANTGESVYNQISSIASSCSKDDTLT